MVEIVFHSPSKQYPARVIRTTERLLASVDPKLLIGLGQIILTNVADLPAKRRRRYWTRRRYFRGTYLRPQSGDRARIEIYLDAIAESGHPAFFRWPMLCGYLIGRTLFHEIGHHINLHTRREFKDAEVAADEWRDRLLRSYWRQFWWARTPRRRRWAVRLLRSAKWIHTKAWIKRRSSGTSRLRYDRQHHTG